MASQILFSRFTSFGSISRSSNFFFSSFPFAAWRAVRAGFHCKCFDSEEYKIQRIPRGHLGKWDIVGPRQFLQFFKCRNLEVKDHQAQSVEHAGRNVHHITTIQSWEEKLTEANRDGKILVANFSAPWSGPCRSIAPTYSELADKYLSFMFLTVDVDALAEFSTSWDINATPTFFFLKDGRQIDKFVGADKVELPKKIAAVANV